MILSSVDYEMQMTEDESCDSKCCCGHNLRILYVITKKDNLKLTLFIKSELRITALYVQAVLSFSNVYCITKKII